MKNSKILLSILFLVLLMSCGASKRVAGNRYGAFTFNHDHTFNFDYRAICFEHRWNHGTWTPVYKTDKEHRMSNSRKRSVCRRGKYDKVLLHFARHDNIPLKVAEYCQSDMKYKMIILPEESFYNIPVWVIVNGEPVNVSNSEREEHVVRLSAAKFPKIESVAIKSALRLDCGIWDAVEHHDITTEVYKVKNPDNNIFCISLPLKPSIRSYFDMADLIDTVVYVKRNAIVYADRKLRKR